MAVKNYDLDIFEREDKNTRYLIQFYVFPLICETREDFENIFCQRMQGVFVGDTNRPDWGKKIVVLFKTCAPKKFKDFYRSNPYSYQNYYEEIDGKYYEILSFQIPPKFKNDLDKLLDNGFTKVSVPFCNHIDWIAYPPDSIEQWHNYNYLHGKLKRIDKSQIQLDLNGVNNEGYYDKVNFEHIKNNVQ